MKVTERHNLLLCNDLQLNRFTNINVSRDVACSLCLINYLLLL